MELQTGANMTRGYWCACDCRDRFTWGLKQEIVRLRGLVRSAYDEGWTDYYELDDREKKWEQSVTKKGLGDV